MPSFMRDTLRIQEYGVVSLRQNVLFYLNREGDHRCHGVFLQTPPPRLSPCYRGGLMTMDTASVQVTSIRSPTFTLVMSVVSAARRV